MSLDPTPEVMRATLHSAADAALRLYSRNRGPGLPPPPAPTPTQSEKSLPTSGRPLATVIQELELRLRDGLDACAHPNFLALIPSAGNFASLVSEHLVTAANANAALQRTAPGAAELETLAIAWVAAFLGYSPQAEGLFVSGSSMANLTALTVARDRAQPEGRDAGRSGLPPLLIYTSAAAHHCLEKCAALLGLGRHAIIRLATDPCGRLDPRDLATRLLADRASGRSVAAVVATLGTPDLGAIDPLLEIGDLCAQHGVWLHLDAAYGGVAAAVVGQSGLLDSCDSIALDLHKWLFAPYEAGCVLLKTPGLLTQSFAGRADYLDDWLDPNQRDPMQKGFELSRRVRAAQVWVLFSVYGAAALRAEIRRHCELARHLGAALVATGRFELLARPELSIVGFRVLWRRTLPPATELDRLVDLVDALRAGEPAFQVGILRRPRLGLRVCIVNPECRAATVNDLAERLLALVEDSRQG